ncbi:MAG: ECF-type sigma factor [Phycisphaerae bacterium]
MGESPPRDLTTVLGRLNRGDDAAYAELMARVYDELRALAARHMQRQFGRDEAGLTLQPTGLVHETFMQLIRQRTQFDNRGHFFAIATRLMVRSLIDYSRQRGAAKRGGGHVRVPLDVDLPGAASADADVEGLADALARLELHDSRKAEVVRLRVLWGLSVDEVAESLGVARATIDRDWAFAKAWLRKELSEPPT